MSERKHLSASGNWGIYSHHDLASFVRESNRIEGIYQVRAAELEAHRRFWALPSVAIGEIERFVASVQPGAKLRSREGMDVRVGRHRPPVGGPDVVKRLERLIDAIECGGMDPWDVHVEYEQLHPFMDGNGRSGRALWAWQMLNQSRWPGIKLGFLHAFYYQTLAREQGLVVEEA